MLWCGCCLFRRLSYSLAELDLSNNTGITGELPAQLGLLPQLRVVKVMQTNLSCAGITQPYSVTTNYSCSDPRICTTPQQFGDPSVPIMRCTQDELLPCFLRFSDYFLPREDSSNMKCKQIIRKAADAAQRDCGGSGLGQLGDLSQQIPDKPVDRWARWEVDPAYFQYQACECLLVSCRQQTAGCLPPCLQAGRVQLDTLALRLSLTPCMLCAL